MTVYLNLTSTAHSKQGYDHWLRLNNLYSQIHKTFRQRIQVLAANLSNESFPVQKKVIFQSKKLQKQVCVGRCDLWLFFQQINTVNCPWLMFESVSERYLEGGFLRGADTQPGRWPGFWSGSPQWAGACSPPCPASCARMVGTEWGSRGAPERLQGHVQAG